MAKLFRVIDEQTWLSCTVPRHLLRTADVMLLARGIYSEKAFDRMPILDDLLGAVGRRR
jgi:hypothetical protein